MMDVDPGYTDSNRAFLQAFKCRPSMTLEEAKPVLAAIFSIKGKCGTISNDDLACAGSDVV